MTKPTITALEQLFAWEVASAFDGAAVPPFIRPPKLARAMIADGLIVEAEATLPGRFPVRVKAHVLTDRGRLLYCEWAAAQPEEVPA